MSREHVLVSQVCAVQNYYVLNYSDKTQLNDIYIPINPFAIIFNLFAILPWGLPVWKKKEPSPLHPLVGCTTQPSGCDFSRFS